MVKTAERRLSRVDVIRSKFGQLRKDLNYFLIERQIEIDLVLAAMVCAEHCLLVGEPGTAKSLLVSNVRKAIEGAKKPFTVHCCKDTTRGAVFGPTKLSALKDDRTDRALAGGAADTHFLILEEVFKAGPAVLDMFLMLINERVYEEGLVSAEAPLRFCLAVSNEWKPEGCEAALAAFFDRFLFRKEVKRVSMRSLDRLLFSDIRFDPKDKITLEELDTATKVVERYEMTKEARESFRTIIENLHAEGIFPGDRRMRKAVKAAKAYAFICQDVEVETKHLDILAHVLWNDPEEQPKKAARIIGVIANPTGTKITQLQEEMEDVVAKNTPQEAVPKLKHIQAQLADLPMNPRKADALEYVADMIKDRYDAVIGRRS